MFRKLLKSVLALTMCTTSILSTFVMTPTFISAATQAPILELLQDNAANVSNGANAYVGSATDIAAVKGLDDFSMNAKIKVTGTSNVQTVFFLGDSSKRANYVSVWLNKNNTVGIETFNTSQSKVFGVSGASSVVFNDDAEHNFSFIYDNGGKFTVYVDGKKGYEAAVSNPFSTGYFSDSATMYLGIGNGNRAENGNNYPFTGTIYDVEVYDRAISENEVKIYAGAAQLVYEHGFVSEYTTLDAETVTALNQLSKGAIAVRYQMGYRSADEVSLLSLSNADSSTEIFVDRSKKKIGFRYTNSEGTLEYCVDKDAKGNPLVIEDDKWNFIVLNATADGKLSMKYNDVEFASDAFATWVAPGFLTSIANATTASIVENSFVGNVESLRVYSAPLNDEEYEELYMEYGDPRDVTGKTAYVTDPIDLFYPNYDGSPAYRIPSLFTTKEGTVIAAIDQRNNGTPDNGNIDTILRRREKGETEWSDPIEVIDLVDNNNSTPCAFLIDPAFVQDSDTGRIFMIVDMFPESSGAMNTNILSYGDGHEEINGKYYQEVFKDGTKFGTIRENGVVYDTEGLPTDYSVVTECEAPYKELGNTYYQGDYVGNAFIFSGSNKGPLQVDRTMYIWLSYSDDDGKTWSCPKNISPMIKPDWALFQGVGPGVGLELQDGTLTFPVYTAKRDLTPTQASAMIYSTDNGETWQMGQSTVAAHNPPVDASNFSDSSKITTEAQAVQLNNGDVKIFMRNYSGKVRVATSKDGGKTWQNMEQTPIYDCYCQLTVQHYNNNGKEYVIMANPGAAGRNVGTINIAEVDANGNLDWKYQRIIEPGRYLYSCLTLLDKDADGDQVFGLHYEHEPDSMYLKYVEFDETWVMDHDAVIVASEPKVESVDVNVTADKLSVTIKTDQRLIVNPNSILFLKSRNELGLRNYNLSLVSVENKDTLTYETAINAPINDPIYYNGMNYAPTNIRGEYFVLDREEPIYIPAIEESKLNATVSAYSSQHSNSTAENTDGAASNVADGNPNTFWHSNYTAGYNLPQSVTLDLGDAKDIYKLGYLPRQNSNSGRVAGYEIAVSTDGSEFETISTGRFETTAAKQFTEFAPTKARYVKFTVTSGVLTNCCTVAELEVYPYDEATFKAASQETLLFIKGSVELLNSVVENEEYSKASRDAYKAVVEQYAPYVEEGAIVSETMAKQAKTEIERANKALVRVVDAKEAADAAKAKTQAEGPYTLLSWNQYSEEIAGLDEIIDNATSKRVNKDVEMKVQYATSLLKVEGAVDTSLLSTRLDVAKGLDTVGKTTQSVTALNSAIANAEAVLAKDKPTQNEVDQAIIDLNAAIEGLVDRPLNEDKLINKSAQTDVHVESCDSQYTGETADKTLDYNNQSLWHSDWSGNDALPISITYDLAKEYNLSDITYLGRQNNSVNGDIFEFDLYVGNDLNNLPLVGHFSVDTTGSGVTEELANKSEFTRVMFNATGRYVKMTVTRSGSDNASKQNRFASMAEIRFYESDEVVVEQANKEALKAVIDEVKALNGEDYSIKSWANATVALEAAEAVYAKEDATQEEVNAAVSSLEVAIAGLIEKPTEPEIVAPEKVTNVKVVQDSYKDVTLTWDAVEGAASYDVYRKAYKEDSVFTKVKTVEDTTLSVSGLMTGKEYSFYVVAKNEAGVSENSDVVAIATQLEGKPTLSIEQVSKTKFTLSWSEIDGATRYIIYRKRGNDPWKKVLTLGAEDSSYTTSEMPKGEYSFIVKAGRYDSKDRVMTGSSNTVKGTSTYSKPVIKLTAGTKQVKVSWSAIEGVKYYEVFRATSEDGKYTKLKTTTATSYTAKSLTSGKRYYFKVRGYKSYNNGEETTKVYTSYSAVKYIKAK